MRCTRPLRGSSAPQGHPQKLTYLKDLSKKVSKGAIDLESLRAMEDDEIVRILDEVRGIGPWTVQMLLIFTLGRTDVFPADDLGVKRGVQGVYSLQSRPTRLRWRSSR